MNVEERIAAYNAKTMDRMEAIIGAPRTARILCDNPVAMTDAPLTQHTIGSRPNECFTCLRTGENAR